MGRLSRSFFEGYTPDVARMLLGKRLVRVLRGRRLSGMIVEVEAYRGSDDPASHAYRGRTMRNEVMFGEPGHAYVYFTYGNHYCLNITTEGAGKPGAVLIRALQPLEGIEVMMRNRPVRDVVELANGPGKLTKAMKIDDDFNGEDLIRSGRLFVESMATAVSVGVSGRIGITRGTDLPWRYFIEGNRFVSRAQNP